MVSISVPHFSTEAMAEMDGRYGHGTGPSSGYGDVYAVIDINVPLLSRRQLFNELVILGCKHVFPSLLIFPVLAVVTGGCRFSFC